MGLKVYLCILCANLAFGFAFSSGERNTTCGPGNYATNGECKACLPGTYRAHGMLVDACLPCEAGSYCAQSGLSEPTGLCPAKYFCPEGTVEPLPCPDNAVSEPGAISEQNCTDGKCPPGTFANGTQCEKCPVGTYQPDWTKGRGPEVCKTCLSGYYCSSVGNSQADGPCAAGYYCPQGSTTSKSIICPVNFYCVAGCAAPTKCPAGTTSKAGSTSSSMCTRTSNYNCRPGYYTYYSSCNPCPSGTYQPSWSNGYDSKICQPCPMGQYCGSQGLAHPSGPCAISGYYCPMKSTSPTSYKCPMGHYCPSSSSMPIACPTGTTSDPGASKRSDCKKDTIPCPAGFYRNRSQCAPCPMGTYQPQSSANEGMSACKPCDSGKYCMYPKASGVTGYCQKGYYCPVRSTMPTSRLCPEDHYCPGGSSIPTKCDNGATSRRGSGSSSDCIGDPKSCAPGMYTNGNACEFCPAGTYQPQWSNGRGYGICLSCDQGKYCDRAGLVRPSGFCRLGYYCPLKSTSPAEKLCPFGHFCPASSNVPTKCPLGKTSSPGSTSPFDCKTNATIECPAGYQISGVECVPCPPGTYKSSSSTGNCTLCNPGYYCKGPGATSTTGYCEARYYCPSGSANSTAVLCPENHYCYSRASSPTACYSGRRSYPGSSSSSDCSSYVPLACPAGQFNNGQSCEKCPVGTFKPSNDRSIGSEVCRACPAGYYCAQTGAVDTTGDCSAGYFCPSASTSPTSIVCPPDHYCPPKSSRPKPCPAGKRTPPASSTC